MATAPRAPRVRLRLSWNSIRLGVVLMAMAMAAINYQSNAAWLMTFLVAGIAGASIPHARRNLAGVELVAGETGDVFAGDPIALPLLLRGTSATGTAWAVTASADMALAAPLPIQAVPAGGEARATLLLAPRKRGRCRVGGLRATSSFPFGLVEAWVPAAAVDLIVYPRPEGDPLDRAPSPVPIDAAEAGSRSGDDFAGHRRHLVGESQRHVDWKAVARGRPMLAKSYQGGGGECRLRWDDVDGDGERRLSQLTRWVLDAATFGWRYGLDLPGVAIEPGTGPAHRERCLRALAVQVVA